MPDKVYMVLSVVAFTTSTFVVADVVEASRFTLTIVVTALSGCISLLAGQIWRRFDRDQSGTPRPRPEPLWATGNDRQMQRSTQCPTLIVDDDDPATRNGLEPSSLCRMPRGRGAGALRQRGKPGTVMSRP